MGRRPEAEQEVAQARKLIAELGQTVPGQAFRDNPSRPPAACCGNVNVAWWWAISRMAHINAFFQALGKARQ